MSLHDDLLDQARHLVSQEKGKPKQASLRRAISTAYYALFHLLINEASRMVVTNPTLRVLVSRTFVHGEMYKASRSFLGGNLPQKFDDLTAKAALSNPLRNVARVFVVLQDARHNADYNLGKNYTRVEAETLVDQASQAFRDWRAIRGDDQAQLYLVCLLLWERFDKIR